MMVMMMVVMMMEMFLLRASHPTLSAPRPAAALTKATSKLVSRTICDGMQNNGQSKICYSLSFLYPVKTPIAIYIRKETSGGKL